MYVCASSQKRYQTFVHSGENWQSLWRIIIPLIRNMELEPSFENEGNESVYMYIYTMKTRKRKIVNNE